MKRRGFSLIECLALIAALGLFMPVLSTVTVRCLRLGRQIAQRTLTPALLEDACLRLRADATGGWTWDGTTLVTPGGTWTVEDGWLRRDGANRFAGVTWTVTRTKGGLHIVISAQGLPDRVIELPEVTS